MSSRSALARREPLPENEHVPELDEPRPPLRADASAGDERSRKPFSFYGDPLIGMAAASIVLLMAFAALLS